MRFHTFLLKYGEIGIKGKNRYLFEDALVRQVRYALKDVDGNFDVHKSQARIYVDCEGDYDYEDTVEHLKRVFGLVGICPVVRMEDKGFEELKKDVVAYMAEMYPDRNFTFKVESRRARKSYPKNSMEISRDLGEAILYAFPEIKVDVHHPDVLVNVEVRNEIYVYSEIIPGAGGMPVEPMETLCFCYPVGLTARSQAIWYPNEELVLRQLISMHRRTQVSVQSKKLLILRRLWQDIPDRSNYML